jgi:hypothetical protein
LDTQAKAQFVTVGGISGSKAATNLPKPAYNYEYGFLRTKFHRKLVFVWRMRGVFFR